MTRSSRAELGGLDTWLALLAGERVWRDRVDPPDAGERWRASLAVFALTIAAFVATIGAFLPALSDGTWPGPTSMSLLGINVLAAAVLAIRPLQIATARVGGIARLGISVAWRAPAFIALAATSAALLPGARLLAALPLGLVAGSDIALGADAIGLTQRPRTWVKRFMSSTPHFGALGALAALISLGRASTGVAVYAGMWLCILAAAGSLSWIRRQERHFHREHERIRTDVRARERARRSSWLHDDVLSEVRLATLRIERVATSPEHTRQELLSLDHRLRLRQLDEAIRAGQPHLYEVVQPHVRRLQALGIKLSGVPSLEVGEARVDESTAHRVNRVLSGLVSNAANAGAQTVGIAIDIDEETSDIVVTVTDDAGGFDLDEIPPGRGLAQLRDELGHDRLTRRDPDDDVAKGSVMTARVPVGRDADTPSNTRRSSPSKARS